MKSCLLVFLFLTACTTTAPKRHIVGPVSKVFFAEYEHAWRALMLALENYPIAEEDKEKGYLQTETIKEESLWKLPFKTQLVPGLKYTIYVQLTKGSARHRPAVQVSITKTKMSRRGFIDTYHRVPSNGLEEKNILYRILRELNVKKLLNETKNKAS